MADGGEPVALGQPQARQGGRGPVDPGVQLAVGGALLAEDQRDRVRTRRAVDRSERMMPPSARTSGGPSRWRRICQSALNRSDAIAGIDPAGKHPAPDDAGTADRETV